MHAVYLGNTEAACHYECSLSDFQLRFHYR